MVKMNFYAAALVIVGLLAVLPNTNADKPAINVVQGCLGILAVLIGYFLGNTTKKSDS